MLPYRLIFLLLLLLSTTAFAQQPAQKEFEGVITYKSTVLPSDTTDDAKTLLRYLGRGATLYFKAGRFKWVTDPADTTRQLEYVLFNPLVSTYKSVRKIKKRDTVDISSMQVLYQIDKEIYLGVRDEKTILNYPCQGMAFQFRSPGFKLVVHDVIMYCAPAFSFNAKAFDQIGMLYLNFFAKHCGALPLRIEIRSNNFDVCFVFEATNVAIKPIDDSMFVVDEKTPVKNTN